MIIERPCRSCGKLKTIEVPTDGFKAWSEGRALIQEAMPTVSAGDRELLISGICEDCFDMMFGPDMP